MILKKLDKYPEYAVTDTGDLYRIELNGKPIEPRKRKPVTTHDGYKRVQLSSGGKQYQQPVHVLVLEAFCGDAPEGFETAHLNGIRDDNRIENLRWTSKKENHSHKALHGTWQTGENHGSSKLNNEAVRQIRALIGKEKKQDIAKRFGVHPSLITLIAKRAIWKQLP